MKKSRWVAFPALLAAMFFGGACNLAFHELMEDWHGARPSELFGWQLIDGALLLFVGTLTAVALLVTLGALLGWVDEDAAG